MILRVANENVSVAWIWKKKKKIFSCGHVSLEIIVYSERSVHQCFTGHVSQIAIIIRGKSSMPVAFYVSCSELIRKETPPRMFCCEFLIAKIQNILQR